jgi:hypothetical protein
MLRSNLKFFAVGVLIQLLAVAPAKPDMCQSNNSLAQCSCDGACEQSDADCRCASANDPGVPLVCTSLDGKKEAACFVKCERSNNDVRCNDPPPPAEPTNK